MKKTMMILLAMMLPMLMTAQAKQQASNNVKVLKTEYAGMDVDEEGPYITVNVKMQVSNVKKEQIACFALLNNGKWDGDNMTIEELVSLTEMMCEGEIELDPVTGTKTVTVPVDVVLDPKLLTGSEKSFYLKTFVVDLKKEAIIGQGAMINFVPNPKESMAKKQQAINAEVIKRATKNLGSNNKGSGKTTKVEVTCSLCGGTGKVQGYGSPVCYECNGTGKKTKTRVKKAAGEQNAFDVLNDLWGM